MKQFVSFLSALFLVALAGGLVYFGGMLFDASKRVDITPYVFQPAPLSGDRIGRPVSLNALSDDFVRDRLIKKFVYEYFYVVPDADNVTMRKSKGPLSKMASPEVFRKWVDTVAPELLKLADSRTLRQVVIKDSIILSGDYYVVTYDLITYNNPNDITAVPVVKSNLEMYLKVAFEKDIREELMGIPFNAVKWLEKKGDPAVIFKFRVDEVR